MDKPPTVIRTTYPGKICAQCKQIFVGRTYNSKTCDKCQITRLSKRIRGMRQWPEEA